MNTPKTRTNPRALLLAGIAAIGIAWWNYTPSTTSAAEPAVAAEPKKTETEQDKVDNAVRYLKSRPAGNHQKLADEVARVELYQEYCGPVKEDYRVMAKAARVVFPETVGASYQYFAHGFQVLGAQRSCGLIREANPSLGG